MIQLYNSMSRSLEDFRKPAGQAVRIFTCGPSIYRRPHIGNYRTFLYEDILVRALQFDGYQVKRVINFTDIEDKALVEAARHKVDVFKMTHEVAKTFSKEIHLLKMQLPDHLEKASESVDAAIKIISDLLKRGLAYKHKGDIFFDVDRFPDFGRLYGLDMSRWPKKKVHFRKDTYPGTRWNLGDFILWHGKEAPDEPAWNAPFGEGRPSWNVQDPAVMIKHFGGGFDINCGGIDNKVRHHDYNIAVMEAHTGKPMAQFYLHGGHLYVDGKPMSKSRQNVLYLEDFGQDPLEMQALRFYLTAVKHYRRKLDFTRIRYEKQKNRFLTIKELVIKLVTVEAVKGATSEYQEDLLSGFTEKLNIDLDIPEATNFLEKELRILVSRTQKKGLPSKDITAIKRDLKKIDSVLCWLF